MTIEEVLREMREYGADGGSGYNPDIAYVWADAIEAAMREPVAYYWMSSKWHRHEVHMAADLPCNAPHDKQPLFTFPPDAAREIEQLQRAIIEEYIPINSYEAMLDRNKKIYRNVIDMKDAEIERLRAELQGPDGFETWKDAAIDERVRRVKAETEIEDKEASLDMMRSRLGERETLLRQCREKNKRLEARATLAGKEGKG